MIKSFSIKTEDTAAMLAFSELEAYAERNGISMSYIITRALIKYKKEVVDGKAKAK
jgi:hypothetical protein